MEQKFFPQG